MSINLKPVELKEKALLVISALCEDFSLSLPKNKTPEKAEKFAEFIYRLSHGACDTSCKHPEWEQEILDVYKKMEEF